MFFQLLLFMFFLNLSEPTVSSSDDPSSDCLSKKHHFTESCKQFCESRRPNTTNGEYHVPCGNPNASSSSPFQCHGLCASHNCPCSRCPTGNYVKCPPKLDTPPLALARLNNPLISEEEPSANQIDAKKEDSIPWWVWLCVAAGILAILCLPPLCVMACMYQRKPKGEGQPPEELDSPENSNEIIRHSIPRNSAKPVPSIHYSQHTQLQKSPSTAAKYAFPAAV